MSEPILHIKDSYFFEIPKALSPAHFKSKADFPAKWDVWVKNDDQFQDWEFDRIYAKLAEKASNAKISIPSKDDLKHEWRHWQHEVDKDDPNVHPNFGKPLDAYLQEQALAIDKEYSEWAKKNGEETLLTDYLSKADRTPLKGEWFAVLRGQGGFNRVWEGIRKSAGDTNAINEFKKDPSVQWSENKLAHYNAHLSGKFLIPQPFATLKNLHEVEPGGFGISKFMVLELLIAIILFWVFTWLAGKYQQSIAPKGRLWNLFEVFLLYIRDQVARPAIGGDHGHEEHEEHEHEHADGHGTEGHGAAKHERDEHGHKGEHVHQAIHNPYEEADRFVPLLWTIFFFILTCNLFGILPWLGSPTAAFGATFAMAFVTFSTVVVSGIAKWGFGGFFLNQIPSMDLPIWIGIVIKPMILAIELLGLLIKHMVLSIRLLANMVAGHLVILAIMGLAFGAQAAISFESPSSGWMWWIVATISVIGSTLFYILELFVAFLQAYVFTFLSALFIGSTMHKH